MDFSLLLSFISYNLYLKIVNPPPPRKKKKVRYFISCEVILAYWLLIKTLDKQIKKISRATHINDKADCRIFLISLTVTYSCDIFDQSKQQSTDF